MDLRDNEAFVALKHRNFRLLWTGQLISVSGSMMQSAAILWHVALLTPPESKPIALGLVGLARIGPIILLSLVSGVFADALDRRRVMLVTQTIMAALSGLLAYLTLSGLESTWPIYVLSALSSGAIAFDSPARQALVPSLVPSEHLPNAISLNSIMFQVASVLGPSIAGIAIAGFGVGSVYVLNALSFFAVIVGLLMMRDLPRPTEATNTISLKSAIEGLRFVFTTPAIRTTMLLDFFATFFASATALLPIFAQDILHVGPQGYGWLYAAPSVGAVLASFVMVRFVGRIRERGKILVRAILVYGVATVVFGLSRSFWLTFFCLAATGASDTVSMVLRNVVRQTSTPDRLRGRMTSVNMIFFMGGPQLGELEAGVVAQAFGPTVAVVSGGLATVLITALIWKRAPRF